MDRNNNYGFNNQRPNENHRSQAGNAPPRERRPPENYYFHTQPVTSWIERQFQGAKQER